MYFEESTQRSPDGCLTCKKRKKKCDEGKPMCKRCVDGSFQCLGYGSMLLRGTPMAIPRLLGPLVSDKVEPGSVSDKSNDGSLPRLQEHQTSQANTSRRQGNRFMPTIPPEPVVLGDVFTFVVSQQIRLSSRVIFKPTRIPIQAAVVHEARASKLKLWSLFVGAKIAHAFFNGYEENCGTLIESFHGRIRATPAISGLSPQELALRLSCLEDLVLYMSMTSNSRAAYHLLTQTLPIFVQLASKYRQLWSPNRAISMAQALYFPPHYHISKFVFYDTMASLTLARSPLAQYDTWSLSNGHERDRRDGREGKVLEWVYGCPIPVVILIAKINAWRAGGVGRWCEDWRQLEGDIMSWTPSVDHVDDSMGRVICLAVQEIWRQTALIYLYMGMCGADSTDLRVEGAVEQVVKLVETVPAGDLLENHIFVPSLVAGIAARLELHRQVLRRKLAVSKNENVWCLRGADFVPVLDRLWHGTGRDGQSVGWNEYAGLVGVG